MARKYRRPSPDASLFPARAGALGGFREDVKYAARLLVKNPLFTAAAVASLGLGVGANTTIFTLVNAVLLNPLPVREPSRLVSIYTQDSKNQARFQGFMPVSYRNFRDYREQAGHVLQGVAGSVFAPLSLTGGGEPEQVFGEVVTGNYFLAGGAGLLVARLSRDLLWSLRPPLVNADALDLRMSGQVLAFTLLVSLVTGLLFGLVPALQLSRPQLADHLKDRTNRPSGLGGLFGVRNVLVTAQVALSVVTLVGAGLFLRSLRNAQRTDPGFEARQLLHRRNGRLTPLNQVGPGYFQTLGIPLVAGRALTEADGAGAPMVAVVNETMAKRLWPDQDPVGKRFRCFGEQWIIEVVGVARDAKYFTIGEDAQPYFYLSLAQHPSTAATLHVRTAGDPTAALGMVRAQVQSLDPRMPLTNVMTIRQLFDQALWRRAWRQACSAPSGPWPSCWPCWASTVSSLFRSPSGPRSSASAWPWARARWTCSGWSWGRRCSRRRSGRAPRSLSPLRPRGRWATSSSACARVIPWRSEAYALAGSDTRAISGDGNRVVL